MCGYDVVNIASGEDGCVDLDALRAALGEDTAGLMLTNPNTVGIFDKNILEITRLVHEPAACAIMTAPTSTPSWVWFVPATWALTAST